MSSDRLFRLQFPKPEWLNSATTRNAGIYAAGALVHKPLIAIAPTLQLTPSQFSIALFILVDSSVYSNSSKNGSDLHMNFVDWIPGIFSFIGMIIINSIDKSRLTGDSFAYSGDGVAWKARVILFLGFAAMAGGLAGGTCIMVLKYVIKGASGMTLWFGASNLVANALVMLRYVSG